MPAEYHVVKSEVGQTIAFCRLSLSRDLARHDRPRKAMVCPTCTPTLKRGTPIMLRYLFLIANLLVVLHAESGADAWLRHAPLDEASARQYRAALPAAVATYTATPVVQYAQRELLRGIRGMLGRTLRIQSGLPAESAILLGTLSDLKQAAPQLRLEA